MRQLSRALVILAACALLASVPVALAAGSSSTPKQTAPPDSPEEQALALYNEGLEHNDRGRKLEAKAEGTAAGPKRDGMVAKIAESYQAAIPLLTEATQTNPGLFQAFSELGYAYRKTGKYDASLEAYGRALTLEPNYTPAIEYRAEAYLGLNRVEEAKQAYDVLLENDAEHAQALLDAMRRWIEARRTEPGDVSAQTVNDLERWVEQRAASAGDKVGHNLPATKRDW